MKRGTPKGLFAALTSVFFDRKGLSDLQIKYIFSSFVFFRIIITIHCIFADILLLVRASSVKVKATFFEALRNCTIRDSRGTVKYAARYNQQSTPPNFM